MEPWHQCAEGVLIRVHVQPRARRSEVVGIVGDAIKIRVAAPPHRGRANEALVNFLAHLLGVSRHDVAVVRGQTSRRKRIIVRGITLEDVKARLSPGT
ncbi:MAG: DUF167 domain-containing protein [Ardenticatenia bacterium]|nr:DUF167 domain-containing protein [Ardenticatenia bacterium]